MAPRHRAMGSAPRNSTIKHTRQTVAARRIHHLLNIWRTGRQRSASDCDAASRLGQIRLFRRCGDWWLLGNRCCDLRCRCSTLQHFDSGDQGRQLIGEIFQVISLGDDIFGHGLQGLIRFSLKGPQILSLGGDILGHGLQGLIRLSLKGSEILQRQGFSERVCGSRMSLEPRCRVQPDVDQDDSRDGQREGREQPTGSVPALLQFGRRARVKIVLVVHKILKCRSTLFKIIGQ